HSRRCGFEWMESVQPARQLLLVFGSRRWIVAEDDVPGRSPVGAVAPVVAPRSPWVVLFALFGAALTAYHWATADPAKPLATFVMDQARTIGFFLFAFGLPGVLARKSPLAILRNFALPLAPLYLVILVPHVASMTARSEGGWILGIAGGAPAMAPRAAPGPPFPPSPFPPIQN